MLPVRRNFGSSSSELFPCRNSIVYCTNSIMFTLGCAVFVLTAFFSGVLVGLWLPILKPSTQQVSNPSLSGSSILEGKLNSLCAPELKSMCTELTSCGIGAPTKAFMIQFLLAKQSTTDATIVDLLAAERKGSTVPNKCWWCENTASSFLRDHGQDWKHVSRKRD